MKNLIQSLRRIHVIWIFPVITIFVLPVIRTDAYPASQLSTSVRLRYYTATKNRNHPLPQEPVAISIDTTTIDGVTD